MKTVKTHSIIALILLLVTSCGISDGNHERDNMGDEAIVLLDSAIVTNQVEDVLKSKLTGKFIIEINEEEFGPKSTIKVRSEGKEYLVDEIAGSATIVDKFEFKQMEIPEDAISACGAWWAGGGDYFYLKVVANQLVIYAGWLDEMAPELNGYNWEERMRIPE